MRSRDTKQLSSPSPRRATCASNALRAIFMISIPLLVLFFYVFSGGHSAVIELSQLDRVELGVSASFGARARPGNPWSVRRTAHRAVGCGGHVNPAATAGHLLRVRYAVHEANGSVVDSTRRREAATLRLGSGQGGLIARALAGMCAGEAMAMAMPDGRRVVVALERVVGRNAEAVAKAEREDALARAVVAVSALRRKNCEVTCRTRGMKCMQQGFVIVNDCGRMRKAFACKVCEVAPVGSAGRDMPCYVAPHAPMSFPRGYCMVSPVVSSSTCEARHPHTHRLCPCVEKTDGG